MSLVKVSGIFRNRDNLAFFNFCSCHDQGVCVDQVDIDLGTSNKSFDFFDDARLFTSNTQTEKYKRVPGHINYIGVCEREGWNFEPGKKVKILLDCDDEMGVFFLQDNN